FASSPRASATTAISALSLHDALPISSGLSGCCTLASWEWRCSDTFHFVFADQYDQSSTNSPGAKPSSSSHKPRDAFLSSPTYGSATTPHSPRNSPTSAPSPASSKLKSSAATRSPKTNTPASGLCGTSPSTRWTGGLSAASKLTDEPPTRTSPAPWASPRQQRAPESSGCSTQVSSTSPRSLKLPLSASPNGSASVCGAAATHPPSPTTSPPCPEYRSPPQGSAATTSSAESPQQTGAPSSTLWKRSAAPPRSATPKPGTTLPSLKNGSVSTATPTPQSRTPAAGEPRRAAPPHHAQAQSPRSDRGAAAHPAAPASSRPAPARAHQAAARLVHSGEHDPTRKKTQGGPRNTTAHPTCAPGTRARPRGRARQCGVLQATSRPLRAAVNTRSSRNRREKP